MLPRFPGAILSLILVPLLGLHAQMRPNRPVAVASRIALDGSTGAPSSLTFGSQSVPLTMGAGGFELTDIAAKHKVSLDPGRVTATVIGATYSASSSDLSLQANFEAKDGVIHVTGTIASLNSADRAIVVRYLLPLPNEDALVEDEISHSFKVNSTTQVLGTVFPIIAMTGKDWGASLSIPPSFPCCFGMVGSSRGLGVEFYLGLSPKPKSFPNRAKFEFVIDTATPGWGFRSALAQYYQRYPHFYTQHYAGSGFWNWNDKSTDIPAEALDLYKFHGFTHTAEIAQSPDVQKELDRDKAHGIFSLDYTIVGQRELKDLPSTAADYDAAMVVFRDFQKKWNAEKPDGPLHASYNYWRNVDLPNLIDRCVVTIDPQGDYRLTSRNSVWARNSITFTMNPNPDLFQDKGLPTVGSTTLKKVAEWFATGPSAGVMVDSLGGQWPNTLNYRPDHFVYARYPLTFDNDGHVAIHNVISHYEYLESLRQLADKNQKLIGGNGVIRYKAQPGDENYNGILNGRFFIASLLDVSTREITAIMDRPLLEFFRVCMGPSKVYTAILYKWKDPAEVALQMNRALVYDVFAAPNRYFADKVSYLTAPNGYARDKVLLAWFDKNARLLHDAGWQPVTYTRVSNPNVACERYGTGNVIYFPVANFSDQPVDCEVDIDLAALKMNPETGAMSHLEEVANNLPVKNTTEGTTLKVTLRLDPSKTQILRLSQAW